MSPAQAGEWGARFGQRYLGRREATTNLARITAMQELCANKPAIVSFATTQN